MSNFLLFPGFPSGFLLSLGLTPAKCRKVKEVGDLMIGEPTTEAPVNSGRNYNGPKVKLVISKKDDWNSDWNSVKSIVVFNSDWNGFVNATQFEKAFESKRHRGYLRKMGKLQTISGIVQETAQDRNSIVANLTTKIDLTNENLDELQYKYNETIMSLSRMLEDKDRLHLAFIEAIRWWLLMRMDSHPKEKEELNKREMLTERERQNLDEEKKKVI
ncbi:hypothetical protein GOBAR_DD00409 [Gossypium barbadense]|nr:hypothetical protein GOBAR_DD00409 [Gossypium barbadense]